MQQVVRVMAIPFVFIVRPAPVLGAHVRHPGIQQALNKVSMRSPDAPVNTRTGLDKLNGS